MKKVNGPNNVPLLLQLCANQYTIFQITVQFYQFTSKRSTNVLTSTSRGSSNTTGSLLFDDDDDCLLALDCDLGSFDVVGMLLSFSNCTIGCFTDVCDLVGSGGVGTAVA